MRSTNWNFHCNFMKLANRIVFGFLVVLGFALNLKGETALDLKTQLLQNQRLGLPLSWLGSSPPSDFEAENVLRLVSNLNGDGYLQALSELEVYLMANPTSSLSASLRAGLGYEFRETGRYSKALEQWEAVWREHSSSVQEGTGPIVDFTLAHWTQLLARLGRIEKLEEIFEETGRRRISDINQQALFNRSFDAVEVMKRKPGISFRCGTAALVNMARAIPGKSQVLWKIMEVPSPSGGFNMQQLIELARSNSLEVVAIERVLDSAIPTPSVVHWKQNHYAAILEKSSAGLHKVMDPTFGHPRWLTAEAINEEASGRFITVPELVPPGFRIMQTEESQAVFGKGNSLDPPIPSPPPCPETPPAPGTCPNCPPGGNNGGDGSGGGGGGGGKGGGPNGGCGSCGSSTGGPTAGEIRQATGLKKHGMPGWRVSEPNIELWLEDTSLAYPVPRTGEFTFDLVYHPNDTRLFLTNIFNLGPAWSCNWLSYIEVTFSTYPTAYDAKLFGRGGGERLYTEANESGTEREANTKLVRLMQSSTVTGFDILYPSGDVARYGMFTTGTGGKYNAFLTQLVEANGRTNLQFRYTTNGTVVRLTSVLDELGQTNLVKYDTNLVTRITEIESPFGNKVQLKYGTNTGSLTVMLTNVVDVVGISSGFTYGWTNNLPALKTMVTPYGNTTFEYQYGDPYAPFESAADYEINRAILVTEPAGAKHLYMYRDESYSIWRPGQIDFLPYSYTGLPSGISVGTNGLDNWNMVYRNSFYWSPRHFAALSTSVMGQFSTNDYRIARLRHWLHADQGGSAVCDVMSMERQASPAMGTEGRKVWYGYLNRPHEGVQGPSRHPNWIADVLPDGSTRYAYQLFDQFGHLTNHITTYTTVAGSLGTRTNKWVYSADGVDLLRHTNVVGLTEETYTYSNHQLATVTDLASRITSFTYDTNRKVTSVTLPTGLITSNVYSSDGFLSKILELEVRSGTNYFHTTNTYTYLAGNVKTQVDSRGLATTNTWDALNRLTSIYYPDTTYISNRFDTTSRPLNLASSRDRLGNWKYFGYNAAQQVTAITNELGFRTSFDYCSCGALDATTDAENKTTQFFYDLLGQQVRTVFSGGTSSTNVYDLAGRRVGNSDSGGVSVTNWFNHQGLLVAVSNAFGQALRVVFDVEDVPVSRTDANGVNTAMSYDDVGRLTSTTNALAGIVRYGYSARGLTAVTNELSRITLLDYDAFGRKTAETNANLEVVRSTYNGAGDLLNLNDGRAKNTWWGYDGYGQVTSKTNHNSVQILRYQYDANGQLTNRWSKAKLATTYRYDAAGNLTNAVYVTSPSITLAYDKNNRLKSMVDATGTSTYTYTDFGALLSEDGPWSDDTVSYAYDAGRRRQRLTLAQPGGTVWSQSYAYDTAGRLDGITAPEGTYDYQYHTSRSLLVQKLVFPNTASLTNGFDGLGRLTQTHLRRSDSTLLNRHDYVYNAGHERTQQTRTDGDYVDYTYDNAGQVRTASGKESGGTSRIHEQFGYSYDAGGNLTQKTNNALIQTLVVDNLNQLSSGSRSGTLTVSGTSASAASTVTVNGSAATLYGDRTFARAGFKTHSDWKARE